MGKKSGDPLIDGFSPALQSSADLHALWNQTLHWISVNFLAIVIASTIGAVVVIALYALRAVGMRLCRDDRQRGHWPNIIGRAISKTSLFFIVMLAAKLVSGYAHPPEAVATTVTFLFTVAAAIQGAVWIRELVVGLVEHRAGGDEDNYSTLGSAVGIIRLLVSVICFAIAILLILDNLGVNTTGLIASLGVGGIAIGLAAQGIFADLFAALSILFDKPFKRGESIKWEGIQGTVETIGLKSTRVRALTGEEIIISNTNLLGKTLYNVTRQDHRRYNFAIGLIYQTPPEVLRALPAMILEIINSVEDAHLVRFGFTGFGASSIDFELIFGAGLHDRGIEFDVRQEVALAIIERFTAEGIEFAYPTQVAFTAAPDGKMIMPYPDSETEIEAK